MLKPLATKILQHLISQNSWANALLQPFAGQSVQFNIAVLHSTLEILEDGSLSVAGETASPQASVTIPASILLRLLAKDESAKHHIIVEGDTHLASELGKVLSNMRWDATEDLSRVIGDIPAQKMADFASQTADTVKKTSINLAEMVSEYWQEEKPIIAKKTAVTTFIEEVDTLRADVARLEKRIDKALKNVSTNNR